MTCSGTTKFVLLKISLWVELFSCGKILLGVLIDSQVAILYLEIEEKIHSRKKSAVFSFHSARRF